MTLKDASLGSVVDKSVGAGGKLNTNIDAGLILTLNSGLADETLVAPNPASTVANAF